MPDDHSGLVSEATIQGFTKDGLAAFNQQFHALVDQRKLASVVTLIARHGEIVNIDAYGVLDVSAPVPVPARTDSIFRIASMTKPITGAAMMMLWEEGKWALEDPVAVIQDCIRSLGVQAAGHDLHADAKGLLAVGPPRRAHGLER